MYLIRSGAYVRPVLRSGEPVAYKAQDLPQLQRDLTIFTVEKVPSAMSRYVIFPDVIRFIPFHTSRYSGFLIYQSDIQEV